MRATCENYGSQIQVLQQMLQALEAQIQQLTANSSQGGSAESGTLLEKEKAILDLQEKHEYKCGCIFEPDMKAPNQPLHRSQTHTRTEPHTCH